MNNPVSSVSSYCALCKLGSHSLERCPDFESCTSEERWEIVRTRRLCFNCLVPNHRSIECTAVKCEACLRPHHKLLHYWGKFGNLRDVVSGSSATCTTNTTSNSESGSQWPYRAFLPVVSVKVVSGSEITILSRRMAKSLGLKSKNVRIETAGVGGVVTEQMTEKVSFIIEDKMGRQTSVSSINLWNFVEAEIAGISKDCPCQLKTDEEVKYEKVMYSSWSRDNSGRFEVKLPLENRSQ